MSSLSPISKNMDGFHTLLEKIQSCIMSQGKIKVRLKATRHYRYSLHGQLTDVLNPLRTNLYRKSVSLRKAKTGRADVRTIAAMRLPQPLHRRSTSPPETKVIDRIRFDKRKGQVKLKNLVSRLVCFLFSELKSWCHLSTFQLFVPC